MVGDREQVGEELVDQRVEREGVLAVDVAVCERARNN